MHASFLQTPAQRSEQDGFPEASQHHLQQVIPEPGDGDAALEEASQQTPEERRLFIRRKREDR